MATTVEFQGEIVTEPAPPRNEASDRLPEHTTGTDRGMDWPLVSAFFGGVIAAYAAIGYLLYRVVAAIG